jgi:hypothetical protein
MATLGHLAARHGYSVDAASLGNALLYFRIVRVHDGRHHVHSSLHETWRAQELRRTVAHQYDNEVVRIAVATTTAI